MNRGEKGRTGQRAKLTPCASMLLTVTSSMGSHVTDLASKASLLSAYASGSSCPVSRGEDGWEVPRQCCDYCTAAHPSVSANYPHPLEYRQGEGMGVRWRGTGALWLSEPEYKNAAALRNRLCAVACSSINPVYELSRSRLCPQHSINYHHTVINLCAQTSCTCATNATTSSYFTSLVLL